MIRIDFSSLRRAYEGTNAALVCPGPSLDRTPDLQARLDQYDLVTVVSEAIYAYREAHYVTCFDHRAAEKTHIYWPPWVTVVIHERDERKVSRLCDHNPLVVVPEHVNLTRAHAGSLGHALGLMRHFSVKELDLWGVDLNMPEGQHYAKPVMDKRPSLPFHEGDINRIGYGELKAPEHFGRFAREVSMHKSEWSGIKVRNMNPLSSLEAFPKVSP